MDTCIIYTRLYVIDPQIATLSERHVATVTPTVDTRRIACIFVVQVSRSKGKGLLSTPNKDI